MSTDWQKAGFGVYVHWPFCLAKCPYCDFNSHVSGKVDQARWRRAMVREIEVTAADLPDRRVDTVFFGGGTPSLMEPETVAAVMETIGRVWQLAPDAEVSLEANPTSVEAGRFRAYAEAGVNRVSMGIQALNDPDLKRLGRMHSVAEARAAFDIARAQFSRVSFDLIYARQHQTLEGWAAELREALAMAVDHFSLYQLTIEDGTRFGDMAARGMLKGLPVDDTSADMYLITQDICEEAGLPAYEISNHAHPGAESRHNQIYWRYGDYAGIGPGAHGRLALGDARMATETLRQPDAWLAAVEDAGHGRSVMAPIAGGEQAVEYLMMSLRLREGSDLRRWAALGGAPIAEAVLDRLIEDGMLEREGTIIRASRAGRPVLNAVLRALLAD